MSKVLELGVEPDHIDSLTRANGITALSELIWNSLDADASKIEISGIQNRLGGYDKIIVRDNGHGLPFDKANEVFGKLGGSEKKLITKSPKGRVLHGKEGKGRYKSLALGDLVTFHSFYKSNGLIEEFSVTFERGTLTHSTISDSSLAGTNTEEGFEVVIENINEQNASQAFSPASLLEIEEKFGSYWTSHPTFKINLNGSTLDFTTLIKRAQQKEFTLLKNGSIIPYTIRIIEWNFENKKKTYLCNSEGIPISEMNLGFRTNLPISVFIHSNYIEELEKSGLIDIANLDETMESIYK
jgi:hypothetical protein